jgi:hypothetical protein
VHASIRSCNHGLCTWVLPVKKNGLFLLRPRCGAQVSTEKRRPDVFKDSFSRQLLSVSARCFRRTFKHGTPVVQINLSFPYTTLGLRGAICNGVSQRLIKHSAAGFEMDLPGWLERCGNVHGDVAEQDRTGQDRTSENCTSRQGIQMVIATEQADTTHTALSGGIRQNTTSDAHADVFFPGTHLHVV